MLGCIRGSFTAVMSMSGRFFLLSFIGFLLGACAKETTVTQSKVKKDVWGNDASYSVGQDEDGNPMMKSDKRSSFENKSSNIASNRDFRGQDYTKKSYRKDRWGGETHYDRKKYAGNTSAERYQKEPWFVRKQASSSNKQASDSKKKFSVNPFRSKRASEQNARRISTSQNSAINNQRNGFQQPTITNWKDQKGLSVKDTNGMLGR